MNKLDIFCASWVVDSLNELDNSENYDVDFLSIMVKEAIEYWFKNIINCAEIEWLITKDLKDGE